MVGRKNRGRCKEALSPSCLSIKEEGAKATSLDWFEIVAVSVEKELGTGRGEQAP